LTGITSGLLMKRTRVNSGKTFRLFTRDWPEWISVEMASHLDLDWVCLQESKFDAKLALLYPTVTFISWEIGVNLPPVNFVFCLQGNAPLADVQQPIYQSFGLGGSSSSVIFFAHKL
jgi:hypothetical protein